MNIEEIKTEIDRLEQSDTNWQNIEKLSWLYVVHDHMAGDSAHVTYAEQDAMMPNHAGEFGQAVSGKNINKIMDVISEHMSVIKILHPKEYQAVLDRISEIP